jgi:carbamoyltransferase
MAIQPWVLGINASHNGSCCLIQGSKIKVAIQEERLSRIKYDPLYPATNTLSINYCLDAVNIRPADLSMIVVSSQSPADLEQNDISLNRTLRATFNRVPVTRVGHHFAHALSAFCTSGFAEAACLVIDGEGSPERDLSPEERDACLGVKVSPWESISFYSATRLGLAPIRKYMVEDGRWLVQRPGKMATFGSLGGMYSAVSQQIFATVLDAGKVMGLAPYGKAVFTPDAFFSYSNNDFIFRDDVPNAFLHADRWPKRERDYQNLAASVQLALEQALSLLLLELEKAISTTDLCYAGGVALNSVANEGVIRKGAFKNVHIVPAAEDSGVALGAAYYGLFLLTGEYACGRLKRDSMGRRYPIKVVDEAISATPYVSKHIRSTNLIGDVARRLAAGEFAAWFQGGSEFGPRSLGQRSILCDPRSSAAKEALNATVKFREPFRPFAPAVRLERAAEWFAVDSASIESPFMLRVVPVKDSVRRLIPAVVHIDGTARMQTVSKDDGLFYELLMAFENLTGVPILLNTSLNIMGEPIVETPEEALWCLLETGLDFCAFEHTIVDKAKSYSGIMGLIPRLREGSYLVPLRTPRNGDPGEPKVIDVTVQVDGTARTVAVPAAYVKIGLLCVGRSTVRSLFDKISSNAASNISRDQFVKALSFLRRFRIIELIRDPAA